MVAGRVKENDTDSLHLNEMNVIASKSFEIWVGNTNASYDGVSICDRMMMVENAAADSECTKKDVDIRKGKSKTPRVNVGNLGDLKNEKE
nr:integrin-linked protein kinase family [Tanacetum cinerariifolium]